LYAVTRASFINPGAHHERMRYAPPSMPLRLTARAARFVAILIALQTATSCKRSPEVVVFHAASLSRAFAELEQRYRARYPDERLRVEVSGSLVAARKVAELGLRADVVAVADAAVIDRLLRPDHAAWNLHFSTNQVVLAHKDHSRFTDELTADNWPEVVARDGVRLGLVNPDTGPIGYRTLFVWQLEARRRSVEPATLEQTLRARCAPEHYVPDESQLLALLEARAVDYAFLYRSTAEEHHLKITALSDEVNLGDAARAEAYGAASTPVRMRAQGPATEVRGAPVIYGLTIPASATNPSGAERLVALLLGDEGQRVLRRSGFSPLTPPRCSPLGAVPAGLQDRCRPEGGTP